MAPSVITQIMNLLSLQVEPLETEPTLELLTTPKIKREIPQTPNEVVHAINRLVTDSSATIQRFIEDGFVADKAKLPYHDQLLDGLNFFMRLSQRTKNQLETLFKP